ncbi:STAS domain-containing protein [Streptomyces sp. NPDC006368]|uniref:STAS domain-containing protein n=1 Tax=Streptomyces sp. NPDC006368 TaxID=3156760 RepID=UPI0033ADFB95
MPVDRLVITPAVVERDAVLALAGELDMDGEAALAGAVGELIEAGYRRMVLDCAGLEFCDSRGFNALLLARRAVHDVGGELVLAAAPERLLSLLTLVGAQEIFIVATTVEQARLTLGERVTDSEVKPA